MIRRMSSSVILALVLGPASVATQADTLLVESVDSAAGVDRPARGMTMESVSQSYGEPGSRSGPVGEPPISSWNYDNFVVYFEDQYVIHSVVPRN